jgi:hypothetical protein
MLPAMMLVRSHPQNLRAGLKKDPPSELEGTLKKDPPTLRG